MYPADACNGDWNVTSAATGKQQPLHFTDCVLFAVSLRNSSVFNFGCPKVGDVEPQREEVWLCFWFSNISVA
jgi:hypothetical protein